MIKRGPVPTNQNEKKYFKGKERMKTPKDQAEAKNKIVLKAIIAF